MNKHYNVLSELKPSFQNLCETDKISRMLDTVRASGCIDGLREALKDCEQDQAWSLLDFETKCETKCKKEPSILDGKMKKP